MDFFYILMLLIGGRPFIDVRASFNSFLPAGLSSTTGELLVEAWLNRLKNHPQFHRWLRQVQDLKSTAAANIFFKAITYISKRY